MRPPFLEDAHAAAREDSGIRSGSDPGPVTPGRFSHICGRTLDIKFLLIRRTAKDRMRGALRGVKDSLMKRRHLPIAYQGRGRLRCTRVLRVFRGSNERPRDAGVSNPGGAPLALCSVAPRSARATELGEDAPAVAAVAPSTASDPSLSLRPLRCATPRWEPSALAALARICAGGGSGQLGPSLPRSVRHHRGLARQGPRPAGDTARGESLSHLDAVLGGRGER